MIKTFKTLINGFLSLLFPPVCAVCRVSLGTCPEQGLCKKCKDGIVPVTLPICRICGIEIAGREETNHYCGECLASPPRFRLARSFVHYEKTAEKLIHRLKYIGDTSALQGVTCLISRSILFEFAGCDCIIPVPLHVNRHRLRGFNQATLLAKTFFPRHKHLIEANWLLRQRNTVSQTSLSGNLRRKNLRGAFVLHDSHRLQGKTVCLVDDVMTTGTTIKECAKVLLHGGAENVLVLTLARVIIEKHQIIY